GMDASVAKPVDPVRLVRAIEDLLRAGAAPASGETPVPLDAPESSGEESVVDMETLANLERLGGRTFVVDLVAQFAHDAHAHLRQLEAAAADNDAAEFREVAHALRSSAANVGATSVFEHCLAVRAITAPDLAENGQQHVRR